MKLLSDIKTGDTVTVIKYNDDCIRNERYKDVIGRVLDISDNMGMLWVSKNGPIVDLKNAPGANFRFNDIEIDVDFNDETKSFGELKKTDSVYVYNFGDESSKEFEICSIGHCDDMTTMTLVSDTIKLNIMVESNYTLKNIKIHNKDFKLATYCFKPTHIMSFITYKLNN